MRAASVPRATCPSVPEPLPRALRWLLLLVAAGLAGHVALVLALGPGHVDLRDTYLYNAQQWAAALLVLARGVAVSRERRVWLLLGVGMAASACGDLVYSFCVAGLEPEPYPSVADPLYMAFYPLAYAALVTLLRGAARDLPRSLWLDGLVSGLALGAAVAAAVYGPLLMDTGGSPGAVVVGLAYPLLDLVLMSMVLARLAMSGWRAEPRLWVVGVALLLCGLSDLLYCLHTSAGTYVEGTLLDSLWPLSNLLLAWAAWRPTRRREREVAPAWILLGTPVASLLVAVAVLVVASRRDVPLVAVGLAAAALLGVLVRLASTLAETRRLVHTQRIAATDELTGLKNRRGFTTDATRLLPGDAGKVTPGALLLLDLDGFKEVNDSLGHHAGDRLLTVVAERLTRSLRSPEDLLGRLGGDEFALFLSSADRPGAVHAAERILAALAEPVVVDGVRIQTGASIGIALAPAHGDSLSLLLRRADIAMYRAKGDRCGHAVYDVSLRDGEGEDRLQRIAELRQALAMDQLTLHYQPKIDLSTGEVSGVEALVRWDHPDRGLVYPDAFLPLVSEAGLMPILTSTVLDLALAQAASWHRDGYHLPVAVNLPSAAVVDGSLPDRVEELLARHAVPANRLQLEITEESLLDDRVRARDVLARLRAAGVRISIDDYGSGYSSLAYLRELPVDELKLDRSFVFPMADDARAAAIVRSTVELAHSLGLNIVAEGVEHQVVASELSSYGCDAAQGFYYSRALPSAELTWWLEQRGQHPARSAPADAALLPSGYRAGTGPVTDDVS